MRKTSLVIALTMTTAWANVANAQATPGIAPINAPITTMQTYGALGDQWWQWALQVVAPENPLLDLTGANCREGQRGTVWFLAGTAASAADTQMGSAAATNRTCTVPSDKAIFFPLVNVAYLAFINEPAEQRTAEFVRSAADAACNTNSIRNVSVMIDGRAVANPDQYFTSVNDSPLFEVQLPPDNILGVTTADDPTLFLSPGVQKGFYIYVKPLAAGSHVIAWTATWDCGSSAPFNQNVHYDLEVVNGVEGLTPN